MLLAYQGWWSLLPGRSVQMAPSTLCGGHFLPFHIGGKSNLDPQQRTAALARLRQAADTLTGNLYIRRIRQRFAISALSWESLKPFHHSHFGQSG